MGPFKFSLCFILGVIGCCLAAPKPIDWDEVGRKFNDFTKKAVPVVKGACGVVNALPQFQNSYPQFQGSYPQFQGGYPQFQGGYPSYQPYYPTVSRNFPRFAPGNFPQFPKFSPNVPKFVPPTRDNFPQPGVHPDSPEEDAEIPSVDASEQDDLNRGGSYPNIPNFIPPTEDADPFEGDDASELDDLNNDIYPSDLKDTPPPSFDNIFQKFNQPSANTEKRHAKQSRY